MKFRAVRRGSVGRGILFAGAVVSLLGWWRTDETAAPGAGNGHGRITLSPDRVLAGDPVSLRVQGLGPGALATIHAQSVGLDDSGREAPYYGEATFMADASGTVDVATTPPVRGYYQGADLRGLFWSQRPVARDAEGRTAIAALHLDVPATVGEDQEVLTLEEDGTVEDRKVLTLDPAAPGVVRQDVRADDLIGAFYYERGARKRPVVVALGGSEGGLDFADWIGPKLASRGFVVLGLAYFAPPTRAIARVSTALNRIPVELIEGARAWLLRRTEADSRRFGLVGLSKGGEFTLVLASIYDWIGAAVAYSPADYVWQGFQYGGGGDMGSSWTCAGIDWPFLPLTGTRQEIAKGRQPGGRTYLARVAKANIAAATPESLAAAAIPVERSHAALMLIGGGDDQLWDSGASVERLAARLKRAAYPHPHEILVYPGAGHGIAGTGWRPVSTDDTDPTQEGGTPEANARAQADSWTRMLRFFRRELQP